MGGPHFSVAGDLADVSKSLGGLYPLVHTIKYDSLITLIGIKMFRSFPTVENMTSHKYLHGVPLIWVDV